MNVHPTQRTCTTCGEPVDVEEAHYPHEESCPNRLVGAHMECGCELVCHPECCPECRDQ